IFMFTCGVCDKKFGCLTSLINHKKAHKNNYDIESKTGTSTDTYSSDTSDLISNNQVNNESSPAFDIQSTSNLVFNNQEIIDKFDSIFDNQEISNQILTYKSAKIFERTILENENNMFIEKIDESQNDDSEYSDISEID
ncbi:14440_t:CDS:2, partial [Cetraspora pellucida]